MQQTEDHCSLGSLSDIAVFNFEGRKVLHNSPLLAESEELPPRVRKPKRPYSPMDFSTTLNSKKQTQNKRADSSPEVFSCDRCKSPYVVNFARCHSSGKDYRPRRVVDPATKKVLTVCNSCRFKVGKLQKVKAPKKDPPSEGEKAKYQENCASFAASLVEILNDPDAARLYCPAFTVRPCQCLQTYLTESGSGEENKTRAENLLSLLKKAKELCTQKKVVQEDKEGEGATAARGKCRSRVFEDFVLEKRKWLREELHLCERACQRVLMYSNNFLHKQLKSAPDRGARIERVGGGGARSRLQPISELPAAGCCRDRCVLLAHTHTRLLETWRASARRSQREARRVLAEMLTPSGGSKANCYRFIRMVTGCSHTTICHVNEYMRCTQGEREPPEHGLRRWWRQHRLKAATGSTGSESAKEPPPDPASEEEEAEVSEEEEEEAEADVESVRIPSARELQQLGPVEGGRQLREQRRRLASLQRQLASEQRRLAGLRSRDRPRLLLGCCSPSHEAQHCQLPADPATEAVRTAPQIVRILEVPPSTPAVPAMAPGPACVDLQPTAGLSFSMAPAPALGTVFFLPDCESASGAATVAAPCSGPLPSSQPTTAGNPVLYAPAEAADGLQAQSAVQLQLQLPMDLPLQLVMAPAPAPAPAPTQLLSLPAVTGAVGAPRIIYLDALSCLAPPE